uniref:CTLH domain-containing protein n=1 Tax=Chenopodium quinoa TaxID=63459 RepID=A0A803KSD9_CHEQI
MNSSPLNWEALDSLVIERGTPEDRVSAIECLRTSLAPCALDAYPEAYEEFKHILLALIYDKDDTNSPISSEWSERRRFEIAGLMSSILRAHLQAHDPLFSMTLRYLISLHKEFCLRQGVPSPISDLTERLLLEERDAPATLQELASGVPILQEEDIQALAHAVQLTRQGAVESLKFTKGDLVQALKNELCRMRLNESILDELVREYCVYRGIVAPGVPSSGSTLSVDTGHLKANQLNATGLSLDGSHDLDCGNSKSSDDGSSIVNAHVDGAEISTVMIRMQDTDVEMRFPCESTSNHDDCSTSSTHQTKNLKVCQRNKSHAVGDGRRRKRWRERNDDPYFPAGILSNESNKREGSEKYSPFDSTYKEDRCETVLSIKDLADRGMAAEVVEEVEALDPEFFGHNSLLLFQLKQVEFLKLVDSGDYSGALKVACSHLGPLAANNHDLLKPLKETLLALLRPNEVDFKRDLPLHALASSLQVAIGRRLGIEEPQLMKVMQATLHTHTEWFNLQMCKDRFESFLKIDALKEVNSLLLADTVSKSHLCAHTYGSSQVTVSSSSAIPEDSNSPTQVSSREVCDEGAILKVMEFLALPRADAIHLLAQCNGNAETAIQQIFGES